MIKQLTTSNQETVNSFNVFYASDSNNKFYWIVKDENKIFDIRPSDNSYVENFDGNVKKYIDTQKKEYNYIQYDIKNNLVKESFRVISISENLHETNYFQNHKMAYDLCIDFSGKATANIYYPDEKKGGYNFNLSEDDFTLLKGIINKLSVDDLSQKYFINDKYSGQAIVINDKYILNDYKKMKSDINMQALIMFSNLITMKYIVKLKATNDVYQIKSSEFTKMYKPESL